MLLGSNCEVHRWIEDGARLGWGYRSPYLMVSQLMLQKLSSLVKWDHSHIVYVIATERRITGFAVDGVYYKRGAQSQAPHPSVHQSAKVHHIYPSNV